MAVMSDADRRQLWADLMADLSRDNEGLVNLTKADLRAAVDGLDAYLNTNATAINAAIPQPARGALTAAQKARLLSAVAMRRYAKGA